MAEYKVMVTGTGSYGVGEGLLKVIQGSRFRNQIYLIGASNSHLTAFKNLVDDYLVLPNAREKNYLDILSHTIKQQKIDILIPGSVAETEIIAEKQEMLRETGADIWVNPNWIVRLFNNKRNTNLFFLENGLKTPKVFSEENSESYRFPLIVKPTSGKSSENILVAYNSQQLQSIITLNKSFNHDFIIQEFIDGEEYTVSLVNLGDIQKVFVMKRLLCKGASQYAAYEANGCIEDIALNLHQLLRKELILNIQLLRKDDQYLIMEINPRFSGSAPFRALLGFNEFDLLFSKKFFNQILEEDIEKRNGCYVIRGYCESVFEKIEENR